MHHISVAVVGGDLRFVRLCNLLCEKGFETYCYGLNHPDLSKGISIASCLEELSHCDYIIGPVPFTRDGNSIFAPLSHLNIPIDLFLEHVKNSYLCLSVLSQNISAQLDTLGLSYTDMLAMDEVAILNAIPTAEGAIQYAMEHSEITLNDSKCLILGFGRCGKILAEKLKGLGAHVYVEARKTSDLAYIEAYHYNPVPLHKLNKYLRQFDFIFNTIPVQILDKEAIDLLAQHAVYIELASSPGGIDLDYSQQKGVHLVPAPSLPGKVAPMTAARIIYQGFKLIMAKQGEQYE